MDSKFMILKNWTPGAGLLPPLGNIYVYYHNIQKPSSLKPQPPYEEESNVYISNPGHMTKMATMPIYGKTLQNSSSPEPVDQFQQNCSIEDWSTGTVLQCIYKL